MDELRRYLIGKAVKLTVATTIDGVTLPVGLMGFVTEVESERIGVAWHHGLTLKTPTNSIELLEE